ncbi:MAG: prepilin-type N-terminal cleavage/methylation domain-containing protein [Gammaproteobacteria bacterium]
MVNKQRGFTLVEIAIVLVIIGLLLGGILKGQELITSARVRNLADQAAGVQAAYYGFVDRFRAIPGDWDLDLANQALPGPAPTGGNNNGRIDNGWGEALAVWQHLSMAGFIQGDYQGGAANPQPNSQNEAPRNAFGGFMVLAHTPDYTPAAAATPKVNLALGRSIPVNISRELDTKMDDGLPSSGVLRGPVAGGAYDPESGFDATTPCVSLVGGVDIWNVDGANEDCNAAHLY